MRFPASAGVWEAAAAAKSPDYNLESLHDRADRIDQRRGRAAREEEADRPAPVVHDQGTTVAALREHLAHDLSPEHRRLAAAIVDLDDRVDRGHMAVRQAGRPPALAHDSADRRLGRFRHAADVEDVGRNEVRVNRLRDRGVDEVHAPLRQSLQAQPEDSEDRPDRVLQEPGATGPTDLSLKWIGTKSVRRATASCSLPPSTGPGWRI